MVKNMTEGSPVKLIVAFAIPMLIGNIFQQIYNIADAVIVGKFVSANALAAVGSAGSITFFMICLINGLTNGACIIAGQCFGAGNIPQLKRNAASLIHIILTLGILFSIIGVLIARPMLGLLNTPPEIIDSAASYLRILLAGIFATALYNGCSAILRALGDSRTPIIALIIASVVNVLLDLLFVIKLNMGVNGVAYATVIAQAVSSVLCISYMFKNKVRLYLDNLPMTFDLAMSKKIFLVGIPSALQSSLISIGGMFVLSLINSFGTSTLAAYTAANKIDSMAIQVVVSIGTSLSVFTSQNIGANAYERIRKAVFQTLCVMLGACITLAVLIMLFRVQILSMFLDSGTAGDSIAIGSQYLLIIGIAYVIAGIMQTFLNTIRGAGDINFSMLAGIVELSTRIIFAYMLSYLMQSSTGIWIATPISWGAACAITVIRYLSGKWKNKVIL